MLTSSQDRMIAVKRANGLSTRAIEKETGINYVTVSHHIKKPDVKALIQQINDRVMTEAANQAADNIIHAVTSYQRKEVKKDPQLREHGFKASNSLLQAIGILPSHAQSQLYVTIMAQSTTYINPQVVQILQRIEGMEGIEDKVVDIPSLNLDVEGGDRGGGKIKRKG